MASSMCRSICFCSSGVTGRFSAPAVASRRAPWPTNCTTLTESPSPRTWSRYCGEGLPGGGRLVADAADPVAHDLGAAGRDGGGREAAHAHHLGGDALAHLGLRRRAGVIDEVRVRVDVDEAGRHHEAARVDGARGLAGEARPDGGNAVSLQRHVGGDAGRAAAVQHGAVLDQERPGHGYWASSTIFTVFILSPTLTLSTTSIPLVTMPKTVYWPSRKLAGARQM